MKRLLFVLMWFLAGFSALAEKKGQAKVDSLLHEATCTNIDTVRLKLLNDVARLYLNISADSAIRYATDAAGLATRLNKKKMIAQSLNSLGLGLKVKGNFAEAMNVYNRAMDIYAEMGDKTGIARLHNNMGNVYNLRKNYREALNSYFAALKLKQELHDKNGIGACLCNIGLVYFNQNDYAHALTYYQFARDTLSNGGDQQFLSNTIDNMGDIWEQYKDYKKAETDYLAALTLRKQMDDPSAIASSYISLAHLYNLTGRYRDAERFGLLAYPLSNKVGSIKLIMDCTGTLAGTYEKLGNYKLYAQYHKLAIAAKDSIYNTEIERKLVEQQMQFEYNEKEALAKAEQAKKDALAAERLVRERNARQASLAGGGLMMVIAGIAFYAFRQKRKDNKIIQKLVNEQEQVIAVRTRELATSNEKLAVTNKKLVDLIQYNAHQVREPLTRITGVIGIIDCFSADEFMDEIWPLIQKAVTDLDTNIHKVIQMADQTEQDGE